MTPLEQLLATLADKNDPGMGTSWDDWQLVVDIFDEVWLDESTLAVAERLTAVIRSLQNGRAKVVKVSDDLTKAIKFFDENFYST